MGWKTDAACRRLAPDPGILQSAEVNSRVPPIVGYAGVEGKEFGDAGLGFRVLQVNISKGERLTASVGSNHAFSARRVIAGDDAIIRHENILQAPRGDRKRPFMHGLDGEVAEGSHSRD
jgi:hypothetical protein